MNDRIKGIIIGFMAAILLSGTVVFADSVLKAIYVDYTPMKILIDGNEKIPADDMKPFIYNGRTYVALRFVGEAFGKAVEWDGATRTVTIAKPKPNLTEYSESFTETTRLSDYWIKTDGKTWLFDGPNGLRINNPGTMALTGILPDAMCDYTVEYEVAPTSEEKYELPAIYLGVDDKGNYMDWFSFIDYFDKTQVSYNLGGSKYPPRSGTLVGSVEGGFTAGEYIPIKIIVRDGQADIYMNGVNLAQCKLGANKSAVVFSYSNTYGRTNSYIRNFKITLD